METASAVSETAAPKRPQKGNGKVAVPPEVSEDEAPQDSAAPQPEGASLNVLTSAIGLMMASPRHRHLFLADLEWALLPPLALKQFRLFTKGNQPVAFATWAFVSAEVEARLKSGQAKLKPSEWKSGEKCWIVELVAPFGGADEFLSVLKKSALPDCEVSLTVLNRETGKRQVGVIGAESSEMSAN